MQNPKPGSLPCAFSYFLARIILLHYPKANKTSRYSTIFLAHFATNPPNSPLPAPFRFVYAMPPSLHPCPVPAAARPFPGRLPAPFCTFSGRFLRSLLPAKDFFCFNFTRNKILSPHLLQPLPNQKLNEKRNILPAPSNIAFFPNAPSSPHLPPSLTPQTFAEKRSPRLVPSNIVFFPNASLSPSLSPSTFSPHVL